MRPIDADALEKSLENYSNSHGLINAFVEFLNVMDEVHTLDVKPVVHGGWIEEKGFTVDTWECDQCHEAQTKKSNFCPSCGAKMESEEA